MYELDQRLVDGADVRGVRVSDGEAPLQKVVYRDPAMLSKGMQMHSKGQDQGSHGPRFATCAFASEARMLRPHEWVESIMAAESELRVQPAVQKLQVRCPK